MRGSDPDATLYWLARMLEGGEDPLFVARRLVRFANEDIGMADPQAIHQTLAAWDVYERLGSPEGELAIAQAVVYLATAPKSIAVYRGFTAAHRAARRTGSLMPPAHVLNAPTRLMKDLGYGKDYQYDPDTADGFSGADYFPGSMDRETYCQPTQTATRSRSPSACAIGLPRVLADNADDRAECHRSGSNRRFGPFWLVVPLVAAVTVQWLRCLGSESDHTLIGSSGCRCARSAT